MSDVVFNLSTFFFLCICVMCMHKYMCVGAHMCEGAHGCLCMCVWAHTCVKVHMDVCACACGEERLTWCLPQSLSALYIKAASLS